MRSLGGFVSLMLVLILAGACSRGNTTKSSSPTSGTISIAVDESLRPLMEAEVAAFEGIYADAHINVKYVSEQEAFADLVNDSAVLIVATRKLTSEEQAPIVAQGTTPAQVNFARDGLALILHRDNLDTLFQWEQIKQILEGKISTWKQLDQKGSSDSIRVVIDHPGSGMVRLLKDSIAAVDKLPATFYAVNTNKAVVEYVSKNKAALGIIGVSWISDEDDATSNKFMSSIRVASVERGGDYYLPFIGFLATKDYPIRRDIFLISREGGSGLATGFSRFLAMDKGQRIVLKAGLVPVTMPIRLVEVNRKPLQ